MFIRSDVITSADVHLAARRARDLNESDIWIADTRDFKPRRSVHGTEFHAYSYSGKRHRNSGTCGAGEERAASWSDYGYLIAHLFNKDPFAQISWYDNEADFVEKIRKHPRRGESTDFLNVLANIEEYAE